MSDDLRDMTLEQRLAWADRMNTRLEGMYEELCEHEQFVNEQLNSEQSGSQTVKLFDLLEEINSLDIGAQTLRPDDHLLAKKHKDLCEQMQLLQRTVNLLKLEERVKSVNTNQ